MSRTKHRQQHAAYQWNPPEPDQGAEDVRLKAPDIASATECTGLEQRPALNTGEAETYAKLYQIHAQKPQGNIGKGNPNNDPSEIKFHRS